MKELKGLSSLKIIEDEKGRTVGFFISNPGLMSPDVLVEFIRYQLEGVHQRIITMYREGQRIDIESSFLQRLREDYRKENLQEPVISILRNNAASSRGLLVMDPDPTFS